MTVAKWRAQLYLSCRCKCNQCSLSINTQSLIGYDIVHMESKAQIENTQVEPARITLYIHNIKHI